jgi:hypothetical protein
LLCARKMPLPNPSPQGGGACTPQPLVLHCLPIPRIPRSLFPVSGGVFLTDGARQFRSNSETVSRLLLFPTATTCLTQTAPQPIPPPCGEGAPKGREGSLLRRPPNSPSHGTPTSSVIPAPSRDPVTRSPSGGRYFAPDKSFLSVLTPLYDTVFLSSWNNWTKNWI